MRKRVYRASGFTLVELIVVIAIIGVLAGILVPSMLGYVTKAKFSSVNASAKSLYDAGMTACRENDVVKPIPSGVYTSDTYADGSNLISDATINKYIYMFFPNAEAACWALRIEKDVPVGAALQKTAGDDYMGTYPHTNNERRDDGDLVSAVNFAETGTWSATRANNP